MVKRGIGGLLDWLNTTRGVGTLFAIIWAYILLELLTGWPSYYITNLLRGFKIFVTEYVLLGIF